MSNFGTEFKICNLFRQATIKFQKLPLKSDIITFTCIFFSHYTAKNADNALKLCTHFASTELYNMQQAQTSHARTPVLRSASSNANTTI